MSEIIEYNLTIFVSANSSSKFLLRTGLTFLKT